MGAKKKAGITVEHATPAGFEVLQAQAFAPDDVVPFDYGGHADSLMLFVLVLVNANHSPMSANKNLGSASNLRREREREIQLSTGTHFLLHRKIHAAR